MTNPSGYVPGTGIEPEPQPQPEKNPNDVTIALGSGVEIRLPCPEAARILAELKHDLYRLEVAKSEKKARAAFPFEKESR